MAGIAKIIATGLRINNIVIVHGVRESAVVIRDICQSVVDLVVNGMGIIRVEIFQGHPAMLTEGHLPEAVQPSIGIDRNGQGINDPC